MRFQNCLLAHLNTASIAQLTATVYHRSDEELFDELKETAITLTQASRELLSKVNEQNELNPETAQ